MVELGPGHNRPWPHHDATVLVNGARTSALLVGPDGRAVDPDAFVDASLPRRDGVELVAGGVRIDLGVVPSRVAKVVVVATEIVGAPVARVLARGDDAVRFAAAAPTVERALLLVELYRRDGGWKVRALGQGYAGGLAELATVHGLRAPRSTAPSTAPSSPPSASPAPFEVTDPVQRLAMVLDDASRSAASFASSAQWAERRLHDELEQVVADPATRVGPLAVAARAAAQGRHDELVGEARRRHDADLHQLSAELDGLERTLPASLARWSAPGWSAPAGPAAWAIRTGELALPGEEAFRAPMVRALPLSPALWVETDLGGPDAARWMLAAMVRRCLAALPERPRVSVVDVGVEVDGAAGAPWAWAGLAPVADPGAASAVIREHLDHLRLVSLAAETGDWDSLPPDQRPGRLLVVCDVPTGLDESAVTALHAVAQAGASYGLSVLVSGSTAPGLDLPVVAALQEEAIRLPASIGGDLVDRYAGVPWVFHPDLGPDLGPSLGPGLDLGPDGLE